MATSDEVSGHAVALAVGIATVGLGVLLLGAAIGLLEGPTDLLGRGGYATAAVLLLGFGASFLVRTLVELVRLGTLRATEPDRIPDAESPEED